MISLGELNGRMSKLNDWSLENKSILKDFEFLSFKEAINFVNKVSDIAEKHNHHPIILNSFKKVRLTLTTHSEGGLSEKDFDVAEEIDKI